jgi:hypothetical protein
VITFAIHAHAIGPCVLSRGYWTMVSIVRRLTPPRGAVLLSPLGDLPSATMKAAGENAYNEAVKTARAMVARGKSREVFPEPGTAERTGRPVLTTYEVFLDKRGPDSKAVPAALLKTVKIPILAVRNPDDPSPGRP